MSFIDSFSIKMYNVLIAQLKLDNGNVNSNSCNSSTTYSSGPYNFTKKWKPLKSPLPALIEALMKVYQPTDSAWNLSMHESKTAQ